MSAMFCLMAVFSLQKASVSLQPSYQLLILQAQTYMYKSCTLACSVYVHVHNACTCICTYMYNMCAQIMFSSAHEFF